ncbi:hypothetical protein [Actinacidiphila glaucinigra]|uniref:hypothetical protein n=1 Tax=Actinacidiphila glaucinigra TaxID=235986 RepID=UPI0035DD7995
MTGRPATGKTPIRSIRVPDGLWDAVRERAAAEDRTITEVIVTALHRYVSAPAPDRDAEQADREA